MSTTNSKPFDDRLGIGPGRATRAAISPLAWRHCTDGLSQESLRALMAGEVAAVRIPGFASGAQCRAFCDAIREAGKGRTREAQTARMTLLGVNFSNYAGDSHSGYFEQVEPSYALVRQIYARAGFDPLERMLARLRSIWPAPVAVAREPRYGRYFAGGIKTRTHSANLHYDFAPHTAEGFHIADVTDQIGWNLYLEIPEGTGHTILYGRGIAREGGPAGQGAARALNLDRAYVQDAPSYTLQPVAGDVVLINTRYPHNVVVEDVQANEWRAQVSSFIGRLADDHLVLWS